MSVEVRLCARTEVAVVAAREVPGSDIAVGAFARQERGESAYLVAWSDGVPVGSGEVLFSDPPELRNLHVDPDRRGSGIGSAIIRAAEATVGAGQLSVGVGVANPEARRLYGRLGYLGTGRLTTTTYTYLAPDGTETVATETDEQLVKDLGT